MPLPKYPTKPEYLTEELRVSIKPSHMESIKAHAAKAGLTVPEFIRGVLFGFGMHIPPVEDEAAQEATQAV